jgi:hypothetical protein
LTAARSSDVARRISTSPSFATAGSKRRPAAPQLRDPAVAGKLWNRIDHELVDRAPWVPLYNPRTAIALGTRVGNYEYHPFWKVLLDQLRVR